MPDVTHHASANRLGRARHTRIRIWTMLLGNRGPVDEARLERERARRYAWVRELVAEISASPDPCRSAGSAW